VDYQLSLNVAQDLAHVRLQVELVCGQVELALGNGEGVLYFGGWGFGGG
jgi:hypothetical protein